MKACSSENCIFNYTTKYDMFSVELGLGCSKKFYGLKSKVPGGRLGDCDYYQPEVLFIVVHCWQFNDFKLKIRSYIFFFHN